MTATASTSVPKWVFLIGVAVWAISIGLLLIWSVRNGSWMNAVGASLLASIAPIALLTSAMENRSLVEIVKHFNDQSYAFLFGDSIFLPFSAAMATLAWRNVQLDGWRVSWQWTLASGIVGLAAGFTFRFILDKPAYKAADAMGSFYAPSKLFHDFGAYPVLFGGLFCIGVPLFVKLVDSTFPFVHLYIASPYLWLVLLGVALWFAMGITHDQHLVPQNLHPNDWMWPH